MTIISPTILNIAAGKIRPLEMGNLRGYFLVNLDSMYYKFDTPEAVEEAYKHKAIFQHTALYCNADVYEFMERTTILFDRVCIYRFLEHVPMDKVLYFIYLISTVTQKGAEIDVIVPNYNTLAGMILHEDIGLSGFEQHNVLLTTELLNEPSCPHASIWTEQRVKHFWEFEGRFKVKVIVPSYEFDGREIYIRFKATRL